MNDGSLEIKANQGHSIANVNDLSLKLVKNPEFDIIHGTYMCHWPTIKTQGLSRMNRNHIHFAKDLKTNCGLRKSTEIYIFIDFKKATDDGLKFFESENGVILCDGNNKGFIEPRYFLKVIDKSNKVLLTNFQYINFIDEYSYHGHLMGKKHLKNVEYANHKKRQVENSIFVSPIPPRTNQKDIIEFFTQFGPIYTCKFGYKYIIIEYENKEPVEHLLDKPIYFNQWKLNIKRRIVDFPQQGKRSPNKSSNTKNSSEDIQDEQLAERLKLKIDLESEPTWEGQLEKFLTHVQDDDAIIQERCTEICLNLNSALRRTFPYGRAINFGSTVTGLYSKQSDVDVFFDIGETIYDDDQVKNQGCENKTQRWTPKSIFKKVKMMLFKNKSIFSQVVPIPLAKIPVIKFHHIPTNTDCDITFKHGLGVHNSQLIKYYVSLDRRLKPLLLIIKHWARLLGLSGTGKITNYSLVMATIFYLQQPNVNLLPTVKELQSSCEPVYISGWLVNFDKNIVPDASNNESSIPELLQGFFKFYGEFNFATNVICPSDGLIVSKIDFIKNIQQLDINVDALNVSKPVCIQDPFELDHNIAEGWTQRLVQTFQQCCNEGVSNCEFAAKDNYMNLLPLICDPILKHKSKSPALMQIAIPAGKFGKFGLPDDFDTRTDIDNKEKFIETNWFKVVYKLIEKIFINIFKFDLQMMYDGISMKQIKIEENSDVHTKDNDKVLFICRGKYCLNRSRKNKIPSLDPTLSCIEREILISDKLLADMAERKEETPIKFICSLEKKTNPLHVMITLTDEQHTKKSFLEIGSYMRSKIPIIIERELLHMIQYKKQL
ncbi:hypothetical protein PV325_010720 [Microctonus aethiopoides]|nr:hypothetical protein PV325_010720 [Microctonus aethiopoides]